MPPWLESLCVSVWVTLAETVISQLGQKSFLGLLPIPLVLEKVTHAPERLVELG